MKTNQCKWMGLSAILVATALLVSGCVGLGNLVFGLYEKQETDDLSSGSLAPTVSVSMPETQSSQALSSSLPPDSQNEPEPTLALLPEVIAVLGQTNSVVKAINGDECASYVMYGGSPVANYYGRNVTFPFTFWMEADQESIFGILDEKIDENGEGSATNIWPENYPVIMIEAEEYAVPLLFGTDAPVTYSMLEEAYNQAPSLEFTAAYVGVDYAYPMDTWTALYELEDLVLSATFMQTNGEYVLYKVWLLHSDRY